MGQEGEKESLGAGQAENEGTQERATDAVWSFSPVLLPCSTTFVQSLNFTS